MIPPETQEARRLRARTLHLIQFQRPEKVFAALTTVPEIMDEMITHFFRLDAASYAGIKEGQKLIVRSLVERLAREERL